MKISNGLYIPDICFWKLFINWVKLHKKTHMRKMFHKLHGVGVNNVPHSRLQVFLRS